jgi:dienelactone hydrolase
MIREKALQWKYPILIRTIRGCLRIVCILFGISLVMLIFWVTISNAERIIPNKEHLEPEHRIEFQSGATPTNPLDFNRPYARIAGYLYKPKNEGRNPAVVLLHDKIGVHRIHIEWAKRLASWGYVALVVDSRDRPNYKPSRMMRAQDAYGALKHLHGLAFVDPERIAVMGWSDGADAILRALEVAPRNLTTLFTSEAKYRFSAGIIYHPRCSPTVTTMYAPLLILMGGKDEYFILSCDAFPEENRAGGEPFRIIVYPGATQYFDYDETMKDLLLNRSVPDPDATQDSIKRIKAFLKDKL